VSRRQHVSAIAELVVAEMDAAQPRVNRRHLRPELAWAARELEEDLAGRLGVIDLVERARDAHLARLDADDGLAVLSVSWREIVVRAEAVLAARGRGSCTRCGARLARKGHRCRRCRLPS